MLQLAPFRRCQSIGLLLLVALLSATSAFIVSPPSRGVLWSWQLAAVTEEQVLAAVEQAETLWAQALEARKNADEAAAKAEAVRAGGDGDHETSHLNPKIISLGSLADGMEAEAFVEEAVKFSEEADKIEVKANAALAETEKLLEQHLKDFPNSPLADDQ